MNVPAAVQIFVHMVLNHRIRVQKKGTQVFIITFDKTISYDSSVH